MESGAVPSSLAKAGMEAAKNNKAKTCSRASAESVISLCRCSALVHTFLLEVSQALTDLQSSDGFKLCKWQFA